MIKTNMTILEGATTFGDAVRLLREARRLTLRELGERVGVSAPFLSDVEHNRRATDKLPELAKALDIELEELKKFDGRMSQDLKHWMASNPELGTALEAYRRSGRPVENLLRSLRSSTRSR